MANWLITIKEPYLHRIVDGTKLYEIRTRVPSSLKRGDTIFVVQSGSSGKIVISFDVAGIYRYTPSFIWAAYWRGLGIKLLDYQSYTRDRRYVYMIEVQNVRKFDNCPNICDISMKRAPQWFTRINNSQAVFFKEFYSLNS